jgi:uroporphyrin-III C-methyltransferase / precorrin-2 dehydrogenase / sirohydrochlorin ferrochelatase
MLTLKAVRALQSADVILYDDLVSDAVLELARREARRICVGKRGHSESCRQDDINSLMVGLAGEGRHVVRLKSGDPSIFGRAGEEIAALAGADITCEVVPGITAASAMAAALGLSLTHRDRAHSVRYVTGHGCTGELPETVDWQGLADPSTTLIVYMGGKTASAMAERLIVSGLDAETPVAAVAGVSRTDEWRWRGTLGDLAGDRLQVPSRQPVIIGIGPAFATATSQRAAGADRSQPDATGALTEAAA